MFALASLALVAGVVSFTSPCTLPLLPGYVSWVAGLDRQAQSARATWIGAGLFVAGFTAVFTSLGATASVVGRLLARQGVWLDRVSGVVIIVMGLVMVGIVRIPVLMREGRIDLSRFASGPGSAAPLGMAFALGWTPCVGPALASILALSAGTTTVARGAFLLFVYSIGMGIPFVAVAAGMRRGRRQLGWVRRHARAIEVSGGLVLVAMGVLVATGLWTILMSSALSWYARLGWPPI